MSVYAKVLRLLLEESTKISLPDADMLSRGFVIENEEGFKYTIKDIVEDEKGNKKFVIASKDHQEVVSYKEIKKNYKRA